MSTEYRVTWAIDVDATGPLEAARTAAQIQADPDSLAHVYDVHRWDRPPVRVDLDRVTVSPIPTPTPTEPHGHTPAPWVVRSGAIYSEAGVPIAQMHREPGNGTTPVERDANARHIVDAVNLLPDLLERLLVMAEWMARDAILSRETGHTKAVRGELARWIARLTEPTPDGEPAPAVSPVVSALVSALRPWVEPCECHGRDRDQHSIMCTRAREALALVDAPPTPEPTGPHSVVSFTFWNVVDADGETVAECDTREEADQVAATLNTTDGETEE